MYAKGSDRDSSRPPVPITPASDPISGNQLYEVKLSSETKGEPFNFQITRKSNKATMQVLLLKIFFYSHIFLSKILANLLKQIRHFNGRTNDCGTVFDDQHKVADALLVRIRRKYPRHFFTRHAVQNVAHLHSRYCA